MRSFTSDCHGKTLEEFKFEIHTCYSNREKVKYFGLFVYGYGFVKFSLMYLFNAKLSTFH